MATLNVPDAKVTLFTEKFLTPWIARNLAAIDEQLAREDLGAEARTQLLAARAEVENKTWQQLMFDLVKMGAKQMKRVWARQDAEPLAKQLINEAEANALAELSDL